MVAPMSNVTAPLPREIPPGLRKFPSARVLVVDDEPLVRLAVGETLSELGYETLEAGDAASARRAILTAPTAPDLVLLDLHLPDSDDLRLASFIRAHAPSASIVVMTAYGTADIVHRAADLGIAIVHKPFDMSELISIVERALAPRSA